MLRKNPMTAPIAAIPRYFTRKSPLTERFLSPRAFMTPISLNSSLMVKLMVNLSITKDTSIRQTLTMSSNPATMVFII